jgi:hypothetical protein
MNISFIRSRRAAAARRGVTNLQSIPLAIVITLAVLSSRSTAQLLVGIGFPSSSNSVQMVNPAVPQVTGIFGSAVNFDPAPGAMVQDSQGRVYIYESNEN